MLPGIAGFQASIFVLVSCKLCSDLAMLQVGLCFRMRSRLAGSSPAVASQTCSPWPCSSTSLQMTGAVCGGMSNMVASSLQGIFHMRFTQTFSKHMFRKGSGMEAAIPEAFRRNTSSMKMITYGAH